MTLYVTKGRRKKPTGDYYIFYILRESFWDAKTKGQRQRYIAYLGLKPRISLTKAKQIAKKLGIPLDELKQINKLKIVPDKSTK